LPTLATQILSFDDFSSLEAHLRVIRDRYKENLKKYEDMLGNILRSNDPTNNSADQKKWTIEMQQNLAGLASRGNTNGAGKDDAKKNLGKLPKLKFANGIGKHKDAGRHVSAQDSEEWISVEQVSILIGQRSKGLAELYFDSINSLKDKITNIDQVISICEKLSTRSSSTSNASLVVSFINDIPSKILVKPANNDTSKKYALMHNIIIPSKAPPSFMRSW
jgi:hypothetical protein